MPKSTRLHDDHDHDDGRLGFRREVIMVSDDTPTEVLTLSATATTSSSSAAVLLIIPGNPGIPQYYTEFAHAVHENCAGAITVIIASHPGHSRSHPPRRQRILSLDEQCAHKVSLLDTLIARHNNNNNFVIAGHSIGAHMGLHVLRERPDAVSRFYGLFPTLMHMARTPRGASMSRVVAPGVRHVGIALIALVRVLLPLAWFSALVSRLTGMNPRGRALHVTVHRLLHPGPLLHATTLARWEMLQVHDKDAETLRRRERDVRLYYGATDGWTPREHYEEMREEFGAARVMLCDEGLPHDFVVKDSRAMGAKVAQWLREDLLIQ